MAATPSKLIDAAYEIVTPVSFSIVSTGQASPPRASEALSMRLDEAG